MSKSGSRVCGRGRSTKYASLMCTARAWRPRTSSRPPSAKGCSGDTVAPATMQPSPLKHRRPSLRTSSERLVRRSTCCCFRMVTAASAPVVRKLTSRNEDVDRTLSSSLNLLARDGRDDDDWAALVVDVVGHDDRGAHSCLLRPPRGVEVHLINLPPPREAPRESGHELGRGRAL